MVALLRENLCYENSNFLFGQKILLSLVPDSVLARLLSRTCILVRLCMCVCTCMYANMYIHCMYACMCVYVCIMLFLKSLIVIKI